MTSAYHCELAVVAGAVRPDVRVEISGDRITAVVPGSTEARATRLAGLTLPGFANAHSHAFHRALRGRTHGGRGDFWSWRKQMYAVVERLDPDSYLALARATYAEMALAGITCVGEFHYLHHPAGGGRYADPNAMSAALVEAAAQAGIRITLLDTCYLAGGIGRALEPVQRRFADRDAGDWAARVAAFSPPGGHAKVGAAIHSVRAVPNDQLPTVAGCSADAPLHVHLSEQPAENDACQAAYGVTPTQLLAAAGALGRRTTAVHATHLSTADIRALGGTGTGACFCPTTERDLADGIGPASELLAAGCALSTGSDSNAMIDPFEEARALELDERLRTRVRGSLPVSELLAAATAHGHRALGWPDAGRIEPGARADLVTVATDSVRLAGADRDSVLAGVIFAAAAADVTDVVVDGRAVVREGRHQLVGDVAAALRTSVGAVAR